MLGRMNLPGVIYEFTTKCNLKCKYCYNHWKSDNNLVKEQEQYNPKETLKQWMKIANTKSFTFSGGEPTSDFKDLIDCIMYVKARNKEVTLITNATLLSKEQLDILIALKVDIFEITVNSYNGIIHDTINDITGSFRKSVNVINYLIRNNCRVVVPIVITSYNVDKIDKTLEYIHNLGVKEIMINRYNIGGYSCNSYEELLPELTELKEAYEICNKFAKSKDIMLYSSVCTPICVIDPDNYSNIRFSHCNYKQHYRYYTLSRNGDIRFCNHSPEILGNIYRNKMQDIVNSEKITKWKETEPEFCSECNKKDICQYGCRAASEQLGLDLSYEDPIVKHYKAKPIV